MTEKYSKSNIIINDIEFKMIREDNKCWIKIEPIKRVSSPTSLHIILNGENHRWDIYDESGTEAHEIYFEGQESNPSFYLKSGENSFRIDCDKNGIKVISINDAHELKKYVKENCHCISSQSSCWAKDVHYTSRPDKPPFDEM